METLIVVIISACNFLSVDPSNSRAHNCKEFELKFTENINAIQCLMGAQAQVAKLWYPFHPDWKIKRITCQERKLILDKDQVAEEDL